MAETVGERVHAVRKALGPNSRRPLSQDAFADLLTRRGSRRYYGPEISLVEQDKKPLSLEDAATIMAVDPLHRTIDWLQHGSSASSTEPTTRAQELGVIEESGEMAKPAAKPTKKSGRKNSD